MKRPTVTFRILPDGPRMTIVGRDAWALLQLIAAGSKGVTPIERPAPRWSGYIFDLRALGVTIETIHENHAGPFPGTHGRYVLRCEIEIVEKVA